MGLAPSAHEFLWAPEESEAVQLKDAESPVDVLQQCWAHRGVPREVLAAIRDYVSFEGRLLGATPLDEEVKHMVALDDHTMVTASAEHLLCWERFAVRQRVRVEATCLAGMDNVVWCGGKDGSIRLYTPDFLCRRIAMGHQVPIAALVVSSDRTQVYSYAVMAGDRVRVWDDQGILLKTIMDTPEVVKALNMTVTLQCPDAQQLSSDAPPFLRLWENSELLWSGDPGDLMTRPSQASSFVITTDDCPFLKAGTTFIATRDTTLTSHCRVSLRGGQLVICDNTGAPRCSPGKQEWRLPARTQTLVTAYCVINGRLVLSTADCVLYVYQ